MPEYTPNLNLECLPSDDDVDLPGAFNENMLLLDQRAIVAAGYDYIASGASSCANIAHGLSATPNHASGYVIMILPDGRAARNQLQTADSENIGASTFDVALDDGVTVDDNSYFTWIIIKVREIQPG